MSAKEVTCPFDLPAPSHPNRQSSSSSNYNAPTSNGLCQSPLPPPRLKVLLETQWNIGKDIIQTIYSSSDETEKQLPRTENKELKAMIRSMFGCISGCLMLQCYFTELAHACRKSRIMFRSTFNSTSKNIYCRSNSIGKLLAMEWS